MAAAGLAEVWDRVRRRLEGRGLDNRGRVQLPVNRIGVETPLHGETAQPLPDREIAKFLPSLIGALPALNGLLQILPRGVLQPAGRLQACRSSEQLRLELSRALFDLLPAPLGQHMAMGFTDGRPQPGEHGAHESRMASVLQVQQMVEQLGQRVANAGNPESAAVVERQVWVLFPDP